jgi:hypothetical protein
VRWADHSSRGVLPNVVCEASIIRRPRSTRDFCAIRENKNYVYGPTVVLGYHTGIMRISECSKVREQAVKYDGEYVNLFTY